MDLRVWGTPVTVVLPLGKVVRLTFLQRHPLLALHALHALFLHSLDKFICEEVRPPFCSIPADRLLGKDLISAQVHEGVCIRGQW